jgi:hypothetical protein
MASMARNLRSIDYAEVFFHYQSVAFWLSQADIRTNTECVVRVKQKRSFVPRDLDSMRVVAFSPKLRRRCFKFNANLIRTPR